jgi:hypothetical protein
VCAGLNNGIHRPPMGWMSWEHTGCQRDCVNYPETCVSEKLFQSVADALVEGGFRDKGYVYVNIDDCYLAPRDAHGQLRADPARFPNGIGGLADYMHARGLKLGIYNDIGTSTCAGDPGLAVSAVPDARADEQLRQDVETFASWGVDSIKVDGCAADKNTFNVTYPKLGRFLNASGRQIFYTCSWPVYFLLSDACNGTFACVPWKLIAQSCNSWRVFKDIMDVWNLPGHAGVANIIDTWAANNAMLAQINAVGAYNDPDMLMIGNPGLSDAQARIQFVLWAMWSAPLMLSTNLRTLSDTLRALLLNEEIIAIDQDALAASATATKLTTLMLDRSVQLWTKPLANGDVAVAVVDLGVFDGEPFHSTLRAADLGLPPTTARFSVRDLLERTDGPAPVTNITVSLRPYDIVCYRLTPLQH